MPYVKWNDSFNTGIEEIDKQHKGLFDTLNELYDAMKSGQGKSIVGRILDKLVDYTKTHFKTEEKYFDLYNYPYKKDHIAKHNEFVKEIEKIKNDFEKGNAFVTVKLMFFLKDWLKNHIQKADQDYVPFVKRR